MTTTERSGISRRDILKKGAIAGAVFWSVPVIESVTSAASATSGCPAAGALQISGAAVIYTVAGSSTVYWAAFAANGTTCETTPSVPTDSDWSTALNICGGFYVQVTGGTVLYGTSCSKLSTPAVNSTCYFEATSSGINVTAAGIAAGVNVLIYLFHGGTFPNACTKFGSKGHWVVACGESNPQCGTSNGCFGGTPIGSC
jgi:hypothetical protein